MIIDIFSKEAVLAMYSRPPRQVREFVAVRDELKRRGLDFMKDYTDKLMRLARVKGSTPQEVDLELRDEGRRIRRRLAEGSETPVETDFLSQIGER